MPRADYQRLSQEGRSEDARLSIDLARPAAHYSPAPFESSNSDDEDDGLLPKEHPSTPGVAERGFDEPSFPGLVLGGYQVRKS